ncbi:hypothetical protein B0H14DRAFT_2557375 [Mycena olivaceomarginata]|nr:hypothetical protein B0H14DRAFT_2557375 [Mycena olivaceomarginata]
MMEAQLYVLTANRPIYAPLKVNKKGVVASRPRVSAIVDSFDLGAQILNSGKFREFIRTTTWDPAAGYPVAAPDTLLAITIFQISPFNPRHETTHSQETWGLPWIGL